MKTFLSIGLCFGVVCVAPAPASNFTWIDHVPVGVYKNVEHPDQSPLTVNTKSYGQDETNCDFVSRKFNKRTQDIEITATCVAGDSKPETVHETWSVAVRDEVWLTVTSTTESRVITNTFILHPPEQAGRSEYTSLDAGCKVLWRAADQHPLPPLPDSFESVCPGRDGIRVILEGGDARSWIGLVPRGAKYDQGTRLYNHWGSFPQITGKRLEWRYSGSKLVALIVRNEWTDDDSKNVSGLVIWRVDTAKLDKACVIGRTPSNEEAQAIADDLSKQCLEKE